MPINAAPLDAMTFSDPVEFRSRALLCRSRRSRHAAERGRRRRVRCRTASFRSTCFRRPHPYRLVAVADEGGISLIWEPNGEPDLAGYLVLRGEPSDATLQPLTPTPVTEARFRDTHVTAGKRYVYAVVAVDSRLPFGRT